MDNMHTTRVGDLRLVATPIPAGSYLVRVHPDDGPHYDRMIVVTPEDEGATLHLFGWIGRPLTPIQWADAKTALFPMADKIRFERLRANGTFSDQTIRLGARAGKDCKTVE